MRLAEELKRWSLAFLVLRGHLRLGVEAHTFNRALRRQKQADLCEFEASLIYRVSSRTARVVTQRNSALRKISNFRIFKTVV